MVISETNASWKLLTSHEVEARLRKCPVVLIPSGPIEEHGSVLPMGTDIFLAQDICQGVVNRIGGGLIYPPISIGVAYRPAGISRDELRAQEREQFFPSAWVSRECCEQVHLELLEALARMRLPGDVRVRACIMLSGHCPQGVLLKKLQQCHNGVLRGMKLWGTGLEELLEDEITDLQRTDSSAGRHGTMWEVSMVKAICPEYVHEDRRMEVRESQLVSQLGRCSDEELGRIVQADTSLGVRLLNVAADKLAAITQDLLK